MFGRFCSGLYGAYGWGGIGMGIFIVTVAVLVVVVLVRLLDTNRNRISSTETALEILEKRYAKGEISKDEFDKIKNDLTK